MAEYEVFMYLDGDLFLNLGNTNKSVALLDYQELARRTRILMKNRECITAQVYLKRNGHNIAEIHFHKDFTGRVTYGKRYKNDYLSCDPLREVVKEWKQ